jgi:hypothetical protein
MLVVARIFRKQREEEAGEHDQTRVEVEHPLGLDLGPVRVSCDVEGYHQLVVPCTC